MFDNPYVNFGLAVLFGVVGIVFVGIAAWQNDKEEGRPKSFWIMLILALVCLVASVVLAYHGRFPGLN